ncbi:TrkA family potassium uptake protein [Deltaproteobacteria bacterium TL4]
MKQQFAVIGLGVFGVSVAKTLAQNGYEVLAIDVNEAKVQDIADSISLALQFDATNKKSLLEAGIEKFDVVFVCIGEDIEASILVVMILKELGIKTIVAKAINRAHAQILELIGVTQVVHPERDMGQRLAYSYIKPSFLDKLESSPDIDIIEFTAPDSFTNLTIEQARTKTNYKLNILAVISHDKDNLPQWNINPLPEEIIKEGEILVVIGSHQTVAKFLKT